jgi:hypothetical protein
MYIMKILYSHIRLIFSGDTVLLTFSVIIFLASLANATQWAILRSCRFCGICTMLFSTTFFLLSSLEVLKPERQKRTIVAAAFFLAAVLLCFRNFHIVVE